MNQEQFWAEMEKGFARCVQISRSKNHDYAGVTDPFKNFRMSEHLGITSTEKGILVRMSDKFQRISNLLDKEAKVADESIEDTLNDLCNYAQILRIYLTTK